MHKAIHNISIDVFDDLDDRYDDRDFSYIGQLTRSWQDLPEPVGIITLDLIVYLADSFKFLQLGRIPLSA
jgi:hypothetical protein